MSDLSGVPFCNKAVADASFQQPSAFAANLATVFNSVLKDVSRAQCDGDFTFLLVLYSAANQYAVSISHLEPESNESCELMSDAFITEVIPSSTSNDGVGGAGDSKGFKAEQPV